MANLGQGLTLTGSFDISATTENTSSAGYLWFDGTNFKYSTLGAGAWSAGGALITGRAYLGGAGTQNAGLALGGYLSSNPYIVACTEEYGGSSWSAGGALIIARDALTGAGTQNAGLAFGGSPGGYCTEEYDGTSWSSGGALITSICFSSGAGTQNAGLAFGGKAYVLAPPFSYVAVSCTEEYNGSTWSAGGALATARYLLGGAGTQNAGLAFGGITPSEVACTEEYDGSSWSAGGALITAAQGLAGAGTQNAGLAFGGFSPSPSPSVLSCTEEYDGSSWTAGGALITARCDLAGAGTQNAGLAFGGRTPSTVACTEEYTKAMAVCTL